MFGVGATRLILPFCTWARRKHPDGTAWAGLLGGTSPPASKNVILFSAATSPDRVGGLPAFCRAWAKSCAEAHPYTDSISKLGFEETLFIHLLKSLTAGMVLASCPRYSA